MEKLLFRWNELKATFWFVPVIIIIFSILLSLGLVYLDGQITIPQNSLSRFFFVSSPDSARSILATISGAMMGVAGTVFSITLVALTLASSQFGPRLIKNFMYVRLNQVVLGAYVSTYLYCLLVLNAIQDANDYTFIPSLSILVAIFAAILNIILLIVFIHQIAISLQADKIISDISEFISKQTKVLFPDKAEETKEREENIDLAASLSKYHNRISIQSPKSGYLEYIDKESLIETISEHDSLLVLFQRPGGHLVEGMEIGLLYSNSHWEKEALENIISQFEIGKIKTSQQDLEFSIHQMVEIALRALSPGINDPYTAIACIDNLTAVMSYLAEAKFPSKYLFDKEENLRIVTDTFEFEGLLDVAFNQIRQFSGSSPAVMIRLMEALITINKFTKNERHKKAVIKHATMVLNVGKRSIKETHDLDDLNKRAEKILK
ncbi:DUF2254 domain-containing protein [Planktosalinus lacus]|uniref:DUF2254 domain-containing protein n=1 Tax=Planktosalinus lacus TaxID=1526573 RepID=A0A8J2V712_9FLAO|nr:DUF2254 domain-containing protein [Planktosalinus lacus]GGD83374.1 hypothetical protein GCM10011312_04350 [Planktosalinus lacus]